MDLGQSPQPPRAIEGEARGSRGGAYRVLCDFCNFRIKITHFYAYFGHESI